MSTSKNSFGGLPTSDIIDVCARLRPDTSTDVVESAAKRTLRSARRHQTLSAEITELDAELLALCEHANPALLAACGVGPEVAATLLIVAGDNPDRLRNEASLPALCGANPIEASSGRT